MRSIKVCEWCGDEFESYHPKRDRFCQKACNNAWWNDYRFKNSVYVPPQLREKVQSMVNEWLASPEYEIKHVPKTLRAKLHKQYSCSEAVDTTSEPYKVDILDVIDTWECENCGRGWIRSVTKCICRSEAVDSTQLSEDSVD